MFSQFGPLEIILVLVVVLIVFGPKRLPSLGRQLGSGMREFKDAVTGDKKDRRDEDDERPALAKAQAEQPAATPAEHAPADGSHEPRG